MVEAIPVIEASNHLAMLRIADFPHLKQSDRIKTHKEVYKRANPFQEKRAVTFEELQKILAGQG